MTMMEFRETEMGKHVLDVSIDEAVHYITFQLIYGPTESSLWDLYSNVIPRGIRIDKRSFRKFVTFVKLGAAQ